ncbi:MAG: tRNA (guanosine(37)-N1)-methyltransferase TrmD, partial [Candidatus Hydrogenedentes bacterium]|nr:tRNA (guanosine(37)-N1)-methyltransferase TrmD [Candidatus Hydrogenedentota bacterium]
MRIDVLTLFPELFEAPLRTSLLGRAIESGILDVAVADIRDFTVDRHRTADDAPYGGGPGM